MRQCMVLSPILFTAPMHEIARTHIQRCHIDPGQDKRKLKADGTSLQRNFKEP
jgi:hypothetical protein